MDATVYPSLSQDCSWASANRNKDPDVPWTHSHKQSLVPFFRVQLITLRLAWIFILSCSDWNGQVLSATWSKVISNLDKHFWRQFWNKKCRTAHPRDELRQPILESHLKLESTTCEVSESVKWMKTVQNTMKIDQQCKLLPRESWEECLASACGQIRFYSLMNCTYHGNSLASLIHSPSWNLQEQAARTSN